jgi:hypothetical protein
VVLLLRVLRGPLLAGKPVSMGRMDQSSARRIQSADSRDPGGKTAREMGSTGGRSRPRNVAGQT